MIPDPCIAPFLNKLLDCIPRHANYIIYASSYVKKLENKRGDLFAKKVDMDRTIQDAARRQKTPTNAVVEWQKQVDDILEKIDEVVKAHGSRSCQCAVCSNYMTGRRCLEMIEDVNELLDRVADTIDRDNSRDPIPETYVVPESMDSYFQEAQKYIEGDNSEASVLGIWGMGGVGKSTLLTMIHSLCIGKPMFSHLILVAVSDKKSNNVSTIQSEIGKELKLKLDENDDDRSKAKKIYNFLRDKNFVLFIEDLRFHVDLIKVGVPNSSEGCGKKRKVVFTTQSKSVCGRMNAKDIRVKCLDLKYSWVLFEKNVGKQTIQSHRRISTLSKDVAKECKGLPLALKIIGSAMRGKEDPEDWKVALQQMKDSQDHNLLGTDELQLVFKISYDFLPTEQLKKCFLSIALWPKDHNISKEELIKLWMGLDIINNFENIDEAYQNGHSLIGRLVDASLLENDYGHYTHVKLHDVVRAVALWIASDCGKNEYKWLVKTGIHLQEAPRIEVKWSEAEYISLMHNRIKELPSGIPSCTRLSTLMLRDNRLTCKSILNSFHKFISLKYLDLSGNRLDSFPESICDLTLLQYLNLSSNEIGDIPERLGNLKELKYLILQWNRIRSISIGVFSELRKLLMLDMFNEGSSENHSLVDVEELKCLEKKLLYLGIAVWGDEVYNKLLTMPDLHIVALRIQNLHITSFNFMSIIRNPYYLRELSIGSSDDLLEIIFEKNDIHEDLSSINLKSIELRRLYKLEKIMWKDIEPQNLFVELQRIDIYSCNLDDITWVIHLPSLKDLMINSCDNMRTAINNEVEPNVTTFHSLKTLAFRCMMNLEKISTRSLAFPELETVEVFECPLLKTLPFKFQSAPKIQEIYGSKIWWDELKWEDNNSGSHFSQFHFVNKVGLMQ